MTSIIDLPISSELGAVVEHLENLGAGRPANRPAWGEHGSREREVVWEVASF